MGIRISRTRNTPTMTAIEAREETEKKVKDDFYSELAFVNKLTLEAIDKCKTFIYFQKELKNATLTNLIDRGFKINHEGDGYVKISW